MGCAWAINTTPSPARRGLFRRFGYNPHHPGPCGIDCVDTVQRRCGVQPVRLRAGRRLAVVVEEKVTYSRNSPANLDGGNREGLFDDDDEEGANRSGAKDAKGVGEEVSQHDASSPAHGPDRAQMKQSAFTMVLSLPPSSLPEDMSCVFCPFPGTQMSVRAVKREGRRRQYSEQQQLTCDREPRWHCAGGRGIEDEDTPLHDARVITATISCPSAAAAQSVQICLSVGATLASRITLLSRSLSVARPLFRAWAPIDTPSARHPSIQFLLHADCPFCRASGSSTTSNGPGRPRDQRSALALPVRVPVRGRAQLALFLGYLARSVDRGGSDRCTGIGRKARPDRAAG
ncbi:hypothetical protein C8R45DRAFT_1123568 [Mycena sanguinolenta]|nr:hypothetical protein C8R45DRAFT_1123568 [Mycena sanguinolenta]